MKNFQEASKKMLSTFPKKYNLDPQTRALHLIEEAVELANSISKFYKKLPANLKKGEIEEGFGGLLFDILILANAFDIDLDKIYPNELKKFKKYSKL